MRFVFLPYKYILTRYAKPYYSMRFIILVSISKHRTTFGISMSHEPHNTLGTVVQHECKI